MPDNEMAPGEVARGFADLRAEIRDLKAGFVGRAEYGEARKHIDTHIRALQDDVKENRDEIGKAMKAIKAVAEREDDRRQLRTQVFVGPIISGIVVGLTVAILLAVVGLR